MAPNFIGCDREQAFLMPPSLRDWVPEDHLVWTILEAVEAMDLSAFYADYRADGHGRPAYDPRMMVGLLLYAYARGNRSSRGIERECREDVAYRVICANHVPDHSTIAEFRVRHEAALAEVFTSVLSLCRRAGLVRVGVVAVDGTKIAANAARTANRSYEQIAREILAEAAETDRREDELYGEARGDELPERLRTSASRRAALREAREELERERAESAAAEAQTGAPEGVAAELDPARFVTRAHGRRAWLREGRRALEERRALEARPVARSRAERLEESARRLEEELVVERRANAAYEAWRRRGVAADGTRRMAPGTTKPYQPPQLPAGTINTTDPDSRLVKTVGQKAIQGYNAQAAVNEHQILVAAEVTLESPDFGHLEPMVDATERELATVGAGAPGVVIADAGYWHKRQGRTSSAAASRCSSPRTPGCARAPAPVGTAASTPSCAACSQPTTARRSTANATRRSSRCSDRSSSTDASTASYAAEDRPSGRNGGYSAPATTCSSSTTTGQPPPRPNPRTGSQPSAPSDRAPAHGAHDSSSLFPTATSKRSTARLRSCSSSISQAAMFESLTLAAVGQVAVRRRVHQ
jgi:transposase